MAKLADINSSSRQSPPKLSVNKLAEYIYASPLRRKRILEQSKHPKNYITTLYSEVREIMKTYILKGRDITFLEESIEAINNKPVKDHQKKDKENELMALTALKNMDLSFLNECEFAKPKGITPSMSINGVIISVNPDLLVYKKNKSQIGALKLHIIKTNNLSKEAQKSVSVLLNEILLSSMPDSTSSIKPSLCLSVDLFKNSVECCPKSYKTRLENIEAACEEIAAVWDKI